ncbi:hypothetical protein BDEG_26707 [Batrachochytrium dendrobatidis JEL423]|uniref:Uncharacterized protein n=1 Tax=Batrachochytrium dendrobatidis (strain JEL423) TaxID=403673 RepID=A0A177WV97_BATDL|nr:hypothetical protein BDEG_26707 [Batrachochytrium dendrobatidis JEL423]
MAQQARVNAVLNSTSQPGRVVEWPSTGNRHSYCSEIYNTNVFTLKAMQESLPKPIYQKYLQQIKGRTPLDRGTADAIAHAVRVWAMDRGATHFTHWFQPQTGTTAEKHDSFLTLKVNNHDGIEQSTPIDAFSGSQLLQSEPDASSFPSGGMRSTFEARGYTIWDTTSPMFLRHGPHKTTILYIPSVFISYNGEALDEKTILLRSTEALSSAAVKLLHLIGEKDTKSVTATLGTEQEYFLIDRALYNLRPDLKTTGRTLLGQVPPKHQQLDDHYFGQVPSRVLACMSETELELYKLGVPIKTRHNEVAPNQFEMAPIFEEASVAVDHNLLLMETLHQVAHRHKLKVLFHEKPFKGVNGSGKHCNWSMSTDSGDNLLEPTRNPETNYRFLLFLVATLDALYKHAGLLRASIASASNEHRLGANEAPPGIVSAFLGDHLTDVLDAVEENREVKSFSQPHLTTVKVGGTVLDLKVSTLPQIARDLTDRNRTSPFAFTGNKFEFRAVGSKQSPSFPVVLLNAAVAASLELVTAALTKQMGSKAAPSVEDIIVIVRGFIKSSKPGIMTEIEVKSRYHILVEKYVKDLVIEGNTLKTMTFNGVLPAIYQYRKDLAESILAQKQIGYDVSKLPEKITLDKIFVLTSELHTAGENLASLIDKINDADEHTQADLVSTELIALMEKVRTTTDLLENLMTDKYWPFPKYSELMF